MQRIRKLRPTPSSLLAATALFVALGGVSYAAATIDGSSIKNKSIAGKKLKNKAITAAKIKNKAITAVKVKNDALTGVQINESKLGTVPSATNAANATNATNAVNATTAQNVAGRQLVGVKKVSATAGANLTSALAAAPEVSLFTAGPFTVYTKCVTDQSAPGTIGFAFVKTSQGGAILNSTYAALNGNPFLEPGTPEIARFAGVASAAGNTAAGLQPFLSVFNAIAPDGTSFQGRTSISAKNGTLPGGDGIYGAGDVCLFSGELSQFN